MKRPVKLDEFYETGARWPSLTSLWFVVLGLITLWGWLGLAVTEGLGR